MRSRPRIPLSLATVVFVIGSVGAAICDDQSSSLLPQGVKVVWDMGKAYRETTPTRERICINGLWRWQPAASGRGRQEHHAAGRQMGLSESPRRVARVARLHVKRHRPALSASRLGQVETQRDAIRLVSARDRRARRVEGPRYFRRRRMGSIERRRLPRRQVGRKHSLPRRQGQCDVGVQARAKAALVGVGCRSAAIGGDDLLFAFQRVGHVEGHGDAAGPGRRRLSGGRSRASQARRSQACPFGAQVGTGRGRGRGQPGRRPDISSQGRTVRRRQESPQPSRARPSRRPTRPAADSRSPRPGSPKSFGTPTRPATCTVSGCRWWTAQRPTWSTHCRRCGSGSASFGWMAAISASTAAASTPLLRPTTGVQMSTYNASYAGAKESFLRLKEAGFNLVYSHHYNSLPGSHLAYEEVLAGGRRLGMLIFVRAAQCLGRLSRTTTKDVRNTRSRSRLIRPTSSITSARRSIIRRSCSMPSITTRSPIRSCSIRRLFHTYPDFIIDPKHPGERTDRDGTYAQPCEDVVRRFDRSRPVYHHGGNAGAITSPNCYLDFTPDPGDFRLVRHDGRPRRPEAAVSGRIRLAGRRRLDAVPRLRLERQGRSDLERPENAGGRRTSTAVG